MSIWYRNFGYEVLLGLRQSSWRRPILKALVRVHNVSYHLISFFAADKRVHPKHNILNYHQFFLDNIKQHDRVLDLGSGLGELAADIAQKAEYVLGIDNNRTSITKARKNHGCANLEFRLGDITELAITDKFDVVILSNTLEHIKDRIALLKNISAIAPRILIRVPMLTRDWVTVYKKQEGFEYRLDDTHFIEYTENDFREEMKKSGLAIKDLSSRFGELYAVCEAVNQV